MTPFFVRLRDCKDGRLPSLDDVADLISRPIGRPPPEWVLATFRDGNALLILDGVDEIPAVDRERLRADLSVFMANQNKGNYFIVSSRPSAAKEGLLKGLKLIEAEVTPMSPNDRSVFIGRWHQAIQK
jgi:hypothetical protein